MGVKNQLIAKGPRLVETPTQRLKPKERCCWDCMRDIEGFHCDIAINNDRD